MSVKVGEIVDLVEGVFEGDRSAVIRGVRPLGDAGPDDLSFLSNPKYEPLVGESRAGVILVRRDFAGSGKNLIRVADPYLSLARVLQSWFSAVPRPEGISPLASIAASAKIGSGVRIAPFASIGENSVIGERVTIFEGSVVGAGAVVGDDTTINSNVSIYHRCTIGKRCILHAGVVVGSDGFGFASSGGVHHKIPQIGTVRIEDDVEIGAGTTIDRAALGETVIGAGTKIDNLVQIGHNVKIGKRCLIVSQVGISGSTEIGDDCVFGGQAGTYGHIRIGSRVMLSARGVLTKDWAGPATLGGYPAEPLREHMKTEALLRRLPKLLERIEALERTLGEKPKEDPRQE